MNSSSDDSVETSSSDDSIETLSRNDVEDDTINIVRQSLKRQAGVACISGMYYEATFMNKKRSLGIQKKKKLSLVMIGLFKP
jgi:hypothetical protein